MEVQEGECDGQVVSDCEHFDEDVCVVELLEAFGLEAAACFDDESGGVRREHEPALCFVETN